MKKLLGFLILGAIAWVGSDYVRSSFTFELTDSREENVAILKRFADEANKDFPKKIDAETAVLRIDVTNAGIVNRYKATSLTYSQIRRAGIMDQIKPVLRQQACSNRSYRKAMEKGFTVSYSYVDRDNVPAGVVTITRTDCGI